MVHLSVSIRRSFSGGAPAQLLLETSSRATVDVRGPATPLRGDPQLSSLGGRRGAGLRGRSPGDGLGGAARGRTVAVVA